MIPLLESIAQSLNYGDLPETWHVPKIDYFSPQKTLYDYQTDALKNAARTLYLYYGKAKDYQPTEHLQDANNQRKRNFATKYTGINEFSVKKYERNTDRKNQRQNPIFRILSEFMPVQSEEIPYEQFINRMCFWMATGSGKTLVMVKIIEYLHRLKQRGEIPPHNILILAPSEYLIEQIRRTIEEFNESGLDIEFVALRESGQMRQGRLGDTTTVYYHRSDNISDVQKDLLTDYRRYENGGKWYVLLDEAHKGGKENSKRQAYYALMAREGFLFNFSATFTDPEDIATTVKKYNLEEFIKNGHGKNIYLNESEYAAFIQNTEEISDVERRKIVLKSLITLAYVSLRVAELREKTASENLYHLPLMLTLVNSVATVKDDLWAFFQTLREIATGEINKSFFQNSKNELADEMKETNLVFGGGNNVINETDQNQIRRMKITDLRKGIFLSRKKGALQLILGKDHQELAFQMKNAAAPFALIRIGETSTWRNELLAGFEKVQTLRERSYFEDLKENQITILMGSRTFFESWDSNRPNVINFINIGGADAKKFLIQAIGRGVRIEPLPGKRRRYDFLPSSNEEKILQDYRNKVHPPETLFLFATNRNAVKFVLEGIQSEKSGNFEKIEGFEISERPKINGTEMQLLVPKYKNEGDSTIRANFVMSHETLKRLRTWLAKTSDSVLVVRDNLSPREISKLRGLIQENSNIDIEPGKDYDNLAFLQDRLRFHLSETSQTTEGMRELDDKEDIVHFRKVQVQLDKHEVKDLGKKIKQVAKGSISKEERREWARRYANQEINEEEMLRHIGGASEDLFRQLNIKNISEHYYAPLIIANRKADFIRHIVQEESERQFLNDLDGWLQSNQPKWDAWMFSKIDESLDNIYIPYYDKRVNRYRNFMPDFIFWMCKADYYQIVFVDPKGMAHTSANYKILGYSKLFEHNQKCRIFRTRFSQARNVKVKLVLFNQDARQQPDDQYHRYWCNSPEEIFTENNPRT